VRDVFANLLISCPNNGGLFLFHRGVIHKLDTLDTTGLVVHGDTLLRALQPAQLLQFESEHGSVTGLERAFDDIHDVLADEEFRYVAVTAANRIVKLSREGHECQQWTFPGEPDSWHINSLARWNGRLVFSAFADLRLSKQYKDVPSGAGFVQDLHSGERLITNLNQPHSLLPEGRNLLLANSANFEIREYGPDGNLLRSKKLDGYTRGIALHRGILYCGLSRSRNVESDSPKCATVVALDATSWEEIDRKLLPTDEIYDIEYVVDTVLPDVLARLMSHATSFLAERIDHSVNEMISTKSVAEDLRSQNERLKQEAVQKNETIREQSSRIDGLESRLVVLQQLEERVMADSARVQALEQRNEELAGQLTETNARFTESAHTMERRFEKLALESVQTEARLTERIGEIRSRVDQPLREVQEQLGQMEQRAGQQASALSALELRLQRRVDRQERLLQTLHRRIEQLEPMLTGKLDAGYAELCRRDDVLGQKLQDLQRELQDLQRELSARKADTDATVRELTERIQAMTSSTSWRVTAPLRWLKTRLRPRARVD